MTTETQPAKRNIWQFPWGYTESFLVAFGIFFTGIFLEIFTSGALNAWLQWPDNLIAGLVFMLFLAVMYLFWRKTYILQWLSQVPAALGAIILFTLLVLFMGFVPQYEPDESSTSVLWLHNVRNSWPFFLSSVYLLTTLGFVTLRRTKFKGARNIGFFLNHFGLWLVIWAAFLGSGDLMRLQIPVHEGHSVQNGLNSDARLVNLPFSIKLIDFSIDEFPAKIALVDKATGLIDPKLTNNLKLVEKHKQYKLAGYKILIDEYFSFAEKDSTNHYSMSQNSESGQAARVKIFNSNGQLVNEGWIAGGSLKESPDFLSLNDKYFLALTMPQPRRFSSLVEITPANGNVFKTRIEVNKPVSVNGWKLYQTGYDTDKGRFSTLSVLEAVRDPWIPVVYSGIFLLIGGALFMFWLGRKMF